MDSSVMYSFFDIIDVCALGAIPYVFSIVVALEKDFQIWRIFFFVWANNSEECSDLNFFISTVACCATNHFFATS